LQGAHKLSFCLTPAWDFQTAIRNSDHWLKRNHPQGEYGDRMKTILSDFGGFHLTIAF
jgi:hypothetical protein